MVMKVSAPLLKGISDVVAVGVESIAIWQSASAQRRTVVRSVALITADVAADAEVPSTLIVAFAVLVLGEKTGMGLPFSSRCSISMLYS